MKSNAWMPTAVRNAGRNAAMPRTGDDDVEEGVELGPPLAQVEDQAGEVHHHVDGDDDRGHDGADQGEGGQRAVLEPQPDGDDHPDHELDGHGDVR
jgi:hypothetical protein